MTELKAKVQEGQAYAGLTPFVFRTKSIILMGHLSLADDDYLLIQGERQVHRRLMGAAGRGTEGLGGELCVVALSLSLSLCRGAFLQLSLMYL